MSRRASLSRQITILSLLTFVLLVTSLGIFGWWAASKIDDRSVARQAGDIVTGLRDISDSMPIQQDSSVIWNDAVLNLRSSNQLWIKDNLVDWMSEYYSHDLVYVLDAKDQTVRAAREGQFLEPSQSSLNLQTFEPIVRQLREKMKTASLGLDDSTSAITGLGEMDLLVMPAHVPAIVSVRPIVPASAAVSQTPGTEFLHISVRLIDADLTAEIAEKYEVSGLRLESQASASPKRASHAVKASSGKIVGYFTWEPYRPASQLIREIGPALALTLIFVSLAGCLLLFRLQRQSSQLELSKARAVFLALHDPLTQIPNRTMFEDRLDHAIATTRRVGENFALHYVDLDRFKHVNDTLGHLLGDELIRQAARRLTALIGDVDTVARLGGDEFAVIQVLAADTASALELSQKIVESLSQPFDLFGHDARVGASIGIVISSAGKDHADDLMRQADLALYKAKESGRGKYELFADDLDDAMRERRALEVDLRQALIDGEGLKVVYQPIFDTQSSTIAGAEALMRWEHPIRGSVSPSTFIGIAEAEGLIGALGLWVMQQACQFAVQSTVPWVAVNVSPLQFRDPNFALTVFSILEETGLAPDRLEIEITEGLLLEDSPMVRSMLKALREQGVRIALDDFGTGYSSISYLQTHRIDKIKIDGSYISRLGTDVEINAIVRSIIDLGNAMHMVVTAEGVESRQQRRILADMGCHQIQGFLLSRPVPAHHLEARLNAA